MPDPISIGIFRDKQAQRIKALEEALSALESLVSRSHEVLETHVDPASAMTCEETISELFRLLDGSERRRIQGQVWRLLGKQER